MHTIPVMVFVQMATAKKLTDNHLTCVICTEVFKDPATLHCNHTFCKSCLLKYTKTQSEAIQAKFISCPSCRQWTTVTNPGCPVEEWVSHLKPSHVIQGLMNDFGPGREDAEICECSVCRNQQKKTSATSWCFACDSSFCDDCLTLHGAMPLSRDHEVVVLSESTKFNLIPKRPFKCKHHATKQIELFCKDCTMAICTICCSINHRKCDDVDTIENMTPQVKEQLTNRTQELNVRIENIQHGISLRKKHGEDFRNQTEEAKIQVRNTRAKVVEMIMKKEKQLLQDIDQSSNQYLQQMQADIKSKEIELQMHQQEYEFSVNAVAASCEIDMYEIYESVWGTFLDSGVTDNKLVPGRVLFTHNMGKLRKAVNELNLCDVKIVHDVCDHKSVPTLYQTIDCKHGRGMSNPALHDVTVLAVDGIKVVVVLDYNNKRLNTYNANDLHGPKYIQLSAGPWQMTQLTNCQVAVSVPFSREIVIVKVHPDPVLLSTIKTRNYYFGLACLSLSQLVAGGVGSTDILDMEGNVVNSISTRKVSSPDFISVTGNRNIIVSEGEVKSVVSVTSDGNAVFRYTPYRYISVWSHRSPKRITRASAGDRALKYPQGITTTSAGDILLADRDSHKVIQLTESGVFVRTVLSRQNGINSPRGICLDRDGFLYVTCKTCVKIFIFQRH